MFFYSLEQYWPNMNPSVRIMNYLLQSGAPSVKIENVLFLSCAVKLEQQGAVLSLVIFNIILGYLTVL